MSLFKKNNQKQIVLQGEDQSLSIKERFLRVVNILFVLLLLVQLLPNHNSVNPKTVYLIGFTVILEAIVILVSSLIKNKTAHTLFVDIISFLYGLLILWTLATAKFNILKESLFPPPGRVFYQFLDDGVKLLIHAGSSLAIILEGYDDWRLCRLIGVELNFFLKHYCSSGNNAFLYVTNSRDITYVRLYARHFLLALFKE